jgi:hypothetical protein
MIFLNKVISEIKSDEIEKTISSDNFPWYWNEHTLSSSNTDSFMFTHTLFSDDKISSSYYYLVEPILSSLQSQTKIEIKKIIRIKVNLLTNLFLTEKQTELEIHTDNDIDNYKSFIYYVIDSDGDTVIYDDSIQSINPRKNTGILFKSNIKHRGSSPQNHKRRIVINFVFEV